MSKISVILPAKNEALSIGDTVAGVRHFYPDAEILVVNDGSTDNTATCSEEAGARVITQPYSKGNGASIKTGLRVATNDVVVCMDADGQHRPEEIKGLLEKLDQGFDMVVGARSRSGQAGVHRSLANGFYNRFASWMVGHRVEDLTSGFRAVKRHLFLEFVDLLPNKFSYPTTITMSFFRAGYSVGYVPIDVKSRAKGSKSHVSLWKDGVRFLLIIFKVGTLYSPLKLFFPISFFLASTGFGYYLYTYFTDGRFTNMGALLLTTSVIVFLMGLLSEQITALTYRLNE